MINISNIFHSDSKHRIFGPIQTDWLHITPSALLVNVDVHGAPDFTVPIKILWGSYDDVLPPINTRKGRARATAKMPKGLGKFLTIQAPRNATTTENLKSRTHMPSIKILTRRSAISQGNSEGSNLKAVPRVRATEQRDCQRGSAIPLPSPAGPKSSESSRYRRRGHHFLL